MQSEAQISGPCAASPQDTQEHELCKTLVEAHIVCHLGKGNQSTVNICITQSQPKPFIYN